MNFKIFDGFPREPPGVFDVITCNAAYPSAYIENLVAPELATDGDSGLATCTKGRSDVTP